MRHLSVLASTKNSVAVEVSPEEDRPLKSQEDPASDWVVKRGNFRLSSYLKDAKVKRFD